MIILNSPGNPTGAVYTKEELDSIGKVAAEEEILILSDEIYEKLVYDEPDITASRACARNITISPSR